MNAKEKKSYLINHVSSLPYIYRAEIDKALRKHSEEVKNRERGDEEEEEQENTVPAPLFPKHLRSFNNELKENKKVYMVLKEENDDFIEKYKKSVQKQKKAGIRPSFHQTFLDLIHLYKDTKGYKIKDLSVKNNLFEQAPLLLENNKIINYFRQVSKNSIYENDMVYLEKLNDIVLDILNNEVEGSKRRVPQVNKTQFITSTDEIGFKKGQKIINKKDLIEQIIENSKAIEAGSNLIQSGDFRNLFLNKEKQTIATENSQNHVDSSGNKKDVPKNLKMTHNKSRKSQSIDISTIEAKRTSFIVPNRKLSPIRYHGTTKYKRNNHLAKTNIPANEDFERIKDDINSFVMERKDPALDKMVESIEKQEVEEEKLVQFIKEREAERPLFREVYKKIDNNELLKIVTDMKKNVNTHNFYEFFRDFTGKYGTTAYNPADFDRIHELDQKINKFDYQIIKKMNLSQKGKN